MDFGDRLKQLREESSLTQQELGEKINLTKANISKYETGRLQPNIDTINFLAKYFNVSTDYLLGRTDTRNPQDYDLIKSLSSDDPELLEILKQFTKREDLKVILKQLLSVDKNEIKPLAKMISGLVSENKELELIINKNNMEADKKLEKYSKKPNYKIMKNEK